MARTQQMEIVGEIGSNYGGHLAQAKNYIEKLAEAGATTAKFQTLRRDRLVAPKIWSEGKWIPNPVLDIFSNLELPLEWHAELKQHAETHGLEFLSTPFYLEAVDVLEAIGVRTYKIASGDLTFAPLLERVAATGKRVVLSTGGSTLQEVEKALETLRDHGNKEVILLHCVVSYPPQWEEANLRAMTTLAETFHIPVGLSDHTPGSVLPVAARALGATFLEKHVTIDRSLPGPDHPFAMTFEEFHQMAKDIRNLELALGTGEKIPTVSESQRRHRFRRGIYDPVTFLPSAAGEGIWLRPVPPIDSKTLPT